MNILNDMKITFIGTSAAKAEPHRFHSSLLISKNQKNILIDAGDGVSYAFLNLGIDFNLIDAIIVSHFHADHLAGLPALITQMIINKRDKPLFIYTLEEGLNTIKNIFSFMFIFFEKYDFEVFFLALKENSETIVSGLSVNTFKNTHLQYQNYKQYSSDVVIFSLSFLFDNNLVYYSADIGSVKDLEYLTNNKVKLFICEAVHIHPLEVIKQKNLNYDKIIFTHYTDEFFQLTTVTEIEFAKDGLVVSI